ncbi:uncharacterized protein LOC127845185 [Dreissena polymorpha]|uniref:uncharacterized protein LOC127845185 n=1 Tax=Dreissena polymorpha TaxID=45954 RepID=UPI0022641A22|nr:uncharacterized protein LOC127845185 [Dreissena polymorpha]
MLSVILVLPDQQELNKTFSKDTLSETLHLYIEGVTDVVMAKLVYCGQVIPRRRETLSALGITGNCRIIIEEADFEDSSDERESEEEQSPEPKQLLHITDISDLERRQSRVFDSLLPAVDITVDRDNIVDDVLTLYRSKPDIIHHRLNVTFEGEEAALDLDGLTREMFSCFFLAMFLKMFSGRTHKLPMVDTRTLFNDTLVIVGKIISHAYVLCNYLPPALSPVVYVLASSGCCSDDLILSSFMSYIPETDQQLVNSLLSQHFDGIHEELVNFISTYGGYEVPKQSVIRQSIVDIAKLNMVVVPFVPIARIKVGLDCYPLLWKGVSESLIVSLLDKFKPTPAKVINLISYKSSDNATMSMLEERIKSYLERFIRSLSKPQLLAFLRFWTSSDTLCIRKLNVEFNSTEGINRRPIANTCDAVLHVSRMYFSAEELAQEFNLHLNDTSARVFDSV